MVEILKVSLQRQRGGISLPEVMIAAVLLGLVIVAISPMMSFSIKSDHINKERSAAIQAAQRIVEEVKSAGFEQAVTIVNESTPSVIEADDLQGNKLYIRGTGEVLTAPGGSAKLLQIQRLYNFSGGATPAVADDIIQVTVKVTWPGSTGRHVTMGTSLTRTGDN